MTLQREWPSHPAADLFPLLGETELKELADDIELRGLLEPVWLYEDPDNGLMLLDGRNRYDACQLAGIDVETRWYRGDEPVAFVISENVKRRHARESGYHRPSGTTDCTEIERHLET